MTVKEMIKTIREMTAAEDTLSSEQKRMMIQKVYDDIQEGKIVVPNFLSDPD